MTASFIPAMFALTTDLFIFIHRIFLQSSVCEPFISSAGMIGKLRYITVGFRLVLACVGVKILPAGRIHFPISLSLGVVAGLLGLSVAASLLFSAEGNIERSSATCKPMGSDIEADVH